MIYFYFETLFNCISYCDLLKMDDNGKMYNCVIVMHVKMKIVNIESVENENMDDWSRNRQIRIERAHHEPIKNE